MRASLLKLNTVLHPLVNIKILLSSTLVYLKNCSLHCWTATADVHKIKLLFLIVDAAIIPTKVFPAPQGKTIIPIQKIIKNFFFIIFLLFLFLYLCFFFFTFFLFFYFLFFFIFYFLFFIFKIPDLALSELNILERDCSW